MEPFNGSVDNNISELVTVGGNNSSISSTSDSDGGVLFTEVRIITYILGCLGLVLNVASILATLHIPNDRTSQSKRVSLHARLIISLALSDICMVLAFLVHDMLLIFANEDCTRIVRRSLITVALILILTNLFAMALNHYIAVIYPFTYEKFINSSWPNCSFALIWTFSLAIGFLDTIIAMMLGAHNSDDFCRSVLTDDFDPEFIPLGFVFFVLICIYAFYLRIWCAVRQLSNSAQSWSQNVTHTTKARSTTLMIILSFTICWLPLNVSTIISDIIFRYGIEFDFSLYFKFHEIFFVLYVVNSLLDPLIYAARIEYVKLGYKRLFNRLVCHHRFSTNENDFQTTQGLMRSQRRFTAQTLLPESTASFDNGSNRAGNGFHIPKSTSTESAGSNGHCRVYVADDIAVFDNEELIKKEPSRKNGFTHKNVDQDMETLSNNTETIGLSPLSEEKHWPYSVKQ